MQVKLHRPIFSLLGSLQYSQEIALFSIVKICIQTEHKCIVFVLKHFFLFQLVFNLKLLALFFL